MNEKRHYRRRRVLKDGKLVFNSRSSLVDCVICDLSEGGARLRIAAPTVLAKSLELLSTAADVLYPMEIVWRSGTELGVAFVGEPRQRRR